MKPADRKFEPLVGYIILEQSQAAIDMNNHRLVAVKHMDLKSVGPASRDQALFLITGASNHIVDNGGSFITAE